MKCHHLVTTSSFTIQFKSVEVDESIQEYAYSINLGMIIIAVQFIDKFASIIGQLDNGLLSEIGTL